MTSHDLIEIAYGKDRDTVRADMRRWFDEHGIDFGSTDERLLRFDVGRDLDGHTFYRCRVFRSLLDGRPESDVDGIHE